MEQVTQGTQQGAQQAPVQVQVVQPAQSSPEDRFLKHLENMGSVPTMTEGDTRTRPAPSNQPAQQQQPADPQAAPGDTPALDGADAAATDEDYEFDFAGSTFRVPKELKEMHDGYMRQQDYTTKTQEIAEMRRSAEAALQQSKLHQEMQQALAPKVSQLNAINERLAQYTRVDWNALYAQDATEANKHSVAFSVLTNQKQNLEREIQQTAQQHSQKLTEAQTQLLDASDKAMAKKVNGWTRDTGKALNNFARQQYGFTENEVNSTLDPRALSMMHDAKQWRDLQASKAQKVVAPTKTLKPAASQGGTSAQEQQAQLRRGLRLAKTDGARDRAAEALLVSRMK